MKRFLKSTFRILLIMKFLRLILVVETLLAIQVFCLSSGINLQKRKHTLVTGGAGFVGSHLVDSLMADNYSVTVLDDLSTGSLANIKHWLDHPNFALIQQDVSKPLDFGPKNNEDEFLLDEIYHLASPASPANYMLDPIKTIKTNSIGTINMLELAKSFRNPPRLVLASTSEVYGDPQVHPQTETYWGNTNPIGPRSCYDESKRLSESLSVAY